MRHLLLISIFSALLIGQNYDSEIQPIWNNSCTASCHNSGNVSGGLNLTASRSYQELVDVDAQGYSGFKRVKPGDPANSVLFQKIVGNASFGERMPKGGSNLSQADEDKIKKWIEDGAKQDWSGGGVSSYSFDFGPGGRIQVDSPIEGEAKWSIETWAKFHQKPSSGSQFLFHLNNSANKNLFLFLSDGNDNGKFAVEIDGGSQVMTVDESGVFDQKFHHYYIEGDGSKIKLFIDGNEKGSIDFTGKFPSSDNKMEIGVEFDGAMDEIRIRDEAGFPGIPSSRYAAGSSVHLLYQFDDQSTTTITDNSGENNHGTISGTARYEADVYGGTGGTEGIDVSFKSNDTFNGKVWIGLVLPGKDPNYWSNTTIHWDLGDHNFPGDYSSKVWDNTINDGADYNLIVFVDQNGDDQWDDATEYGAISLAFNITNKQGNAGSLELKKGRDDITIHVEVVLQEELTPGQVWFGVWEVGQDPTTTQPIHEFNFGEDPPFVRFYGFNWTLEDGKSYFISGYFDMNNNNMPDKNEPQGQSQDFTWPVSEDIRLVLEDMSGPDIDVGSITGTTGAAEGQDVTIALNINSPHGVQSVAIEYYVGGNQNKQTSGMSKTGGDTWEGSISASDITSRGLLFEIKAVDTRGRESYSGIDEIRVDFNQLHMINTPNESYIMISAAGQLQNSSMNAVLDELGEADPKVWRFFRWTGNGYQENSGAFTYGKSYWLITKDGTPIIIGDGKSTPLMNPPSISLSPGWNMIATPYDFPIGINDQAVYIEGDIEPTLHTYNGTNYTSTTRLNQGEGAWVFANGSASIRFNFVSVIQGDESISNDGDDEFEQDGWEANFIAKAGNKEDVVNVFGTHPDASDEWDKHDRREPPVIGDYISVAFENQTWSDRGGRYSQDIRSENGQTQSWTLAARTNIKGIVTLELEDVVSIPGYQDVRLVDTALGLVYNLRSEKEVTFTSQGTENPYYFQLMVGPADDIQDQLDLLGMVPQSFELAQNTPNPFNPVTNIRISLIEDAKITLKVYNLLGEELNAIAVNESLGKGNHRFIWAGKDDNGRQLPSGVYLYRLEVTSTTGIRLYQDTKKMVLMK